MNTWPPRYGAIATFAFAAAAYETNQCLSVNDVDVCLDPGSDRRTRRPDRCWSGSCACNRRCSSSRAELRWPTSISPERPSRRVRRSSSCTAQATGVRGGSPTRTDSTPSANTMSTSVGPRDSRLLRRSARTPGGEHRGQHLHPASGEPAAGGRSAALSHQPGVPRSAAPRHRRRRDPRQEDDINVKTDPPAELRQARQLSGRPPL